MAGTLRCPACHADIPAGSLYCGQCGTPIRAPVASPEVRKTVTVLFMDLAGSTALGERLDPEAIRLIMARYFEVARAELERHGGTVEKFIGDAVMAVFGLPVVHEDDAPRAARAAEGIRERLRELNQELARDFGVELDTRTGINSGEVVVGTAGQTLVTGDPVNVAARLEQSASPGEVLIARPRTGWCGRQWWPNLC